MLNNRYVSGRGRQSSSAVGVSSPYPPPRTKATSRPSVLNYRLYYQHQAPVGGSGPFAFVSWLAGEQERTHAYTHTHARVRARAHTQTHDCHAHTHTHTHTHTHHTHTHTHTHTFTLHSHTRARKHTHIHTHSLTHTETTTTQRGGRETSVASVGTLLRSVLVRPAPHRTAPLRSAMVTVAVAVAFAVARAKPADPSGHVVGVSRSAQSGSGSQSVDPCAVSSLTLRPATAFPPRYVRGRGWRGCWVGAGEEF